MAGLEEVMARIAGRFARVEPRRRARAFLLGLLADLPRKNCCTRRSKPPADEGRVRRAWDAVMGIVKLGTNKAVVTAAIDIGNQAANDLGAAIHHLHP